MKKLVALALVVAVAFGAAGCGKKEAKSSGYVIAGTGNMNGDFVDGWGNNSYDSNVKKLVFGGASTTIAGLMTSDENGKFVNNIIVESSEISEDGLTRTYKLKEGLVFSDGTPLNADDVVFTYETYMDSKAIVEAGGSTSTDKYVKSVEKIDDLTIKFVLKDVFWATDTIFAGNILSKEWALKDKPADKTVQQHIKDSLLSSPVGYGPYKIVEYKPNEYIKLTVNELSLGNLRGNKPKIKDVIIKVTDDNTDLDELLTGSIDLLPIESKGEKIDTIKKTDGFTYNNYLRHGYGLFAFHTDFGVVRNKEVRQAISYAFDRDIFRTAFLGEYAVSTDGPYSASYWMIDQEWVDANLTKYTADPAKVNEILSNAGWAKGADGIWAKNGEKLVIEMAAGLTAWVDTINLIVADSVEKYGIKFNVTYLDFSILLDHYYGRNITDASQRKYHMFALGSGLTVVFNPYDSSWHSDKITEPWGSGVSTNSTRFVNKRNDELCIIMRDTTNADEYQAAYKEWVKLMNEEMPILPLYSNDYHDLYNDKIKNLKTNALWDWTAAIVEAYVEE